MKKCRGVDYISVSPAETIHERTPCWLLAVCILINLFLKTTGKKKKKSPSTHQFTEFCLYSAHKWREQGRGNPGHPSASILLNPHPPLPAERKSGAAHTTCSNSYSSLHPVPWVTLETPQLFTRIQTLSSPESTTRHSALLCSHLHSQAKPPDALLLQWRPPRCAWWCQNWVLGTGNYSDVLDSPFPYTVYGLYF